MDGRDARIAAKRARKQEEAEMAAAYERLKQELADRRGVAPPAHADAYPTTQTHSGEITIRYQNRTGTKNLAIFPGCVPPWPPPAAPPQPFAGRGAKGRGAEVAQLKH